MPLTGSPQAEALVAALRDALRDAGWTGARLAKHFDISESTAKRWLAGRGLTLDRLEAMAGLVGLTLAELADSGDRESHKLAQQLTLAQENALSEDGRLSLLFITLLGGEAWEDFSSDFGLPVEIVEKLLAQLDRLALIDLLPGGGVRVKIDRSVLWRKTPLRRRFETEMKPQFMTMDFADLQAVYFSELVKLSDAGAKKLAEMIERHRRELQTLAKKDRRESLLPRRWQTVLYAARPLDIAQLGPS
ncbi:MAG: helix-turn-helix transcriptional regulator [Pseudomonadota bacterium]